MAIPAALGGELRHWIGILLVVLITAGVSGMIAVVVYLY